MPVRKLSTTTPREYLKSGDYMVTFAMASADLECILFQKLLFEKEIKAKQMERWSLYTFIEKCLELGLIEQKWKPLLDEFRNLRNSIIHGRGFLIGLMRDPTKVKNAQNILLAICDFIDQIEVVYKWNMELEREYGQTINH